MNKPMHICRRAICAALMSGAGLPEATPHAVAEPKPEGDAGSLIASLAAAVDAGSKTFVIPAAVYRFGRRSFELKNLREMQIDGQGSTFIFALRGGRVHLESCQNVTVKNLFLDMEHPPFIQGTIRAIDRANQTIDFSVDDGFLSQYRSGEKSARYVIMDPSGRRELPLPDAPSPPPVELPSGLLRGRPVRLFQPGDDCFDVGSKIVVNMRGSGGGVSVKGSSGITLEAVVVYAAGSFAFHESGRSEGGNVYRRCKLVPRPGSPSIWAGAADAFHSMNQRRGPHLVDCEFSWAFDDLINIHGFINLVIEKRGPDHLLLAGPFERDFDVGDTLKFYRYPDAVPAGEAVVTEIAPAPELSRKEIERRATDFFRAASSHNPVRSFPGSEPSLVKLDRQVDVKDFDLAVSSAYSGRGAVIENCHLHNGHVRGILLKSPDAIIKNCTIEHIHRSGIVLYAEQYWLEGPFPDNIKIADNALKDCGFASLPEGSITTMSAFGVPRGRVGHAYNIRNIELVGNTITDAPGVAIKLVNADGVLVRNNTVINPLCSLAGARRLDFSGDIQRDVLNDVMRNPYYGIVTISSRNVRSSGNRAEQTPAAWRGMIGAGSWSENIRAEEHVLFSQPEVSEIGGRVYVIERRPLGEWFMISWQKSPFTPDGKFVPVDWDPGEKTGLSIPDVNARRRAQRGMRNAAGSTVCQMYGDAVGAYLNSADLSGDGVDAEGHPLPGSDGYKQMITPSYMFAPQETVNPWRTPGSRLEVSLDMQIPTAVCTEQKGSLAYVNPLIQLTDPNTKLRLSWGPMLFSKRSKGEHTKPLQHIAYDAPSRSWMIRDRLVPGASWLEMASGSASYQSAPWRGWRHFSWSVSRDHVTAALEAMRRQEPAVKLSADPGDYQLTWFHLNAETHFQSAPAELGWSMRNLRITLLTETANEVQASGGGRR